MRARPAHEIVGRARVRSGRARVGVVRPLDPTRDPHRLRGLLAGELPRDVLARFVRVHLRVELAPIAVLRVVRLGRVRGASEHARGVRAGGRSY